jgi:hypothetical protein
MLLDTSGLLCLHNRAEPFHAHARTLYHAAHGRLTHNYVLAEFVALAHARRLPRMAALTFIVDLVGNPDIDNSLGRHSTPSGSHDPVAHTTR